MKRHYPAHGPISITISAIIIGLAITPVSALTAGSATTASTGTTNSSQSAKLTVLIERGNTEITRRLTTLSSLNAKISSAKKLSGSNAATLSSEVSSEISGLTALKTKLDADTDLTTARSDAQSVIDDYRVYALIVPKIDLVKTADDQQAAETSLTAMATKIQTRLTAAQQANKNVTSLQASLADMQSKTTVAQTISNSVEAGVINVQPTDYDSNHTVLSGDRDQLQTAASDLKAALADATALVSGLKTLE
jgi:hypothetical protein